MTDSGSEFIDVKSPWKFEYKKLIHESVESEDSLSSSDSSFILKIGTVLKRAIPPFVIPSYISS